MERFNYRQQIEKEKTKGKLKNHEMKELMGDVGVILNEFSESNIESLEMDDFVDVFGEEEIEVDKKRVEEVEQRKVEEIEGLNSEEKLAKKEAEERGKALERTMEWVLYDLDFFHEFLPARASVYDDYINGHDILMMSEGSEVVLGLDVTTAAQKEETVSKKIERNMEKMIDYGAAKARYYSSEGGDYKGENKKVIPVVVGLDLKNCKELFPCFLQAKRLERTIDNLEESNLNEEEKKRKKKELYEKKRVIENEVINSSIYSIFFDQVEQQLEKYLWVMEKNPKNKKDDVEKECNRFLKEIQAVRKERYGDIKISRDGIFDNIKEKLGDIDEYNLKYFSKAS